MKAYPRCDFVMLDGRTIYNNVPGQKGVRNDHVRNVSSSKGYISLYEYNIDRPVIRGNTFYGNRIVGATMLTGTYSAEVTASIKRGDGPVSFVRDNGRIYPWISKDSARSSFKTVGATSYNNEFEYGEVLTGEYPLKAAISRDFTTDPSSSATTGPKKGVYNTHYVALRNKLNYYSLLSEHYKVSSSYGIKNSQPLNMIAIPSIFYGTKIQPGSVSLKMYVNGAVIGELQDRRKNGELLQVDGAYRLVTGSTSGSTVAGVVLYNEGYILLTGSWPLAAAGFTFGASSSVSPSWLHFGYGTNSGETQIPNNVTHRLTFNGTTETQVMTMFAHAKRGEVNYSTNPTFLEYGQDRTYFTSSNIYEENSDLRLKNFVSSSYSDYSASFKRQVYVSRVGIYDANKNLIGVATLADPVLKKESEDISFKLKIDI